MPALMPITMCSVVIFVVILFGLTGMNPALIQGWATGMISAWVVRSLMPDFMP